VTRYCAHLREQAAGRGGEAGVSARERLGQAQAALAEAKAGQLRGELVEVAEVESFWRGKLKAFRNRILAIGDRMRQLPMKDHARLMGVLRSALTELADAAH
jgi:phage terminase Nu1 subunit (DNA packaging protein)